MLVARKCSIYFKYFTASDDFLLFFEEACLSKILLCISIYCHAIGRDGVSRETKRIHQGQTDTDDGSLQ